MNASSLEQRYGTRRPRRRLGLVVATVLVAAAGLGWVVWAAVLHANPPLEAQVAGFQVRDDHRVDGTLEVRVRDRDVSGSCLLRATASDHAVVGERTVRVDGATAGSRRVSLRTERRATTLEAVRCTESGH